MKKWSIAYFAIAMLILASCKQAEKISLQPNFKPGEKYSLTYAVDFDQAVMGMNTSMNISTTYLLDIKEADTQKGFSINMTFGHFKMGMKTPMPSMNYDFDSDKPDDSSNLMTANFSKIFGKMINKTILLSLENNGHVKEVKGYKEMLQSIIDSSFIGSPGINDDFKKNISGNMNENQIRSIFQQTFGFYPSKPVAIGESWNNTMEASFSNMQINQYLSYKIKELHQKENEILLDVTGKIGSGANAEIKQNGISMKMDMDGDITGTMLVDIKTGFVKKGKLVQNIKAKMAIMGQSVPLEMKGIVNIEGKKI